VVGGRDASTGRRSRPEGVTFQRGFDGAQRREPEVGLTRARSSARSADERMAKATQTALAPKPKINPELAARFGVALSLLLG